MKEMGIKITAVLFCFLFVNATEVYLNSSWKQNFGWEVTCSWNLFANDSLQSVRLYKNEQQFMIYRPETDGTKRSQIFRLPEDVMQVDCSQSVERGLMGKCILTLELYQPPNADITYTCEVSGERPMFRIDKKDTVIKGFVTPNDAEIDVVKEAEQPTGRVMLNCTTNGLPAPSLAWMVGDTKVPNDFSGSVWNVTSKLWHVWSLLSYTPSNSVLTVTCTPEVSHDGQLVRGNAAEYNTANGIHGKLGVKNTIVNVLLTLALLR